jgi:hypothetical protein
MYRLNLPEYFIWHLGNKYILARTHSLACAHSLIEGIINSELAVHTKELPLGHENVLTKEYLKYDVFSFRLQEADEEPDLSTKDLMRLAVIRAKWLTKLETLVEKYRLRFYNTHDPGHYQWIHSAITESNPNENLFSPLIKEYADILGIPDSSAYYDMKMKYDTFAVVNIKAWAFYEKFKRKINDSVNGQEMREIVDQCRYDIFYAAKI